MARTRRPAAGMKSLFGVNFRVISREVAVFLSATKRSVVGRPCSILPSSAPSSAAL